LTLIPLGKVEVDFDDFVVKMQKNILCKPLQKYLVLF
jgi:hypothetical protein